MKRVWDVIFVFGLGVLLSACARGSRPVDGSSIAPVQTAVATMTPAPPPPPSPKTEPPIIVTPETAVAHPDEEALFILNVIVEDRYGYLQEAMLTLTWPDMPRPVMVGPTADIKIPIPANSPPFLLTVEKEGYITVYQPFDVTLNADMQYEFIVTMLVAGDPA